MNNRSYPSTANRTSPEIQRHGNTVIVEYGYRAHLVRGVSTEHDGVSWYAYESNGYEQIGDTCLTPMGAELTINERINAARQS